MDYPGEKLIIRMWETVAEKGIGSVFKPWQLRREGRAITRAKVDEALALAQAAIDADKIKRGEASYSVSDGRLISHCVSNAYEPPVSVESQTEEIPLLVNAASDAAVADKIKKEINLTKALLYAEEALSDEAGDPPVDKPDEDWLSRWGENAGAVSNKEMQNLWGRILAGEIKNPGRFSLRVLDFIRNISKEEADLIAEISKYIINGVIFKPDDPGFFEKKGVNFSKLIELEDLGILIGVSGGGFSSTYEATKDDILRITFISNDHVINIVGSEKRRTVNFTQYNVTKIGIAIAALAAYEDDLDYIFSLNEMIAKQGVRSTVHKISSRNDEGVPTQYVTEPIKVDDGSDKLE